MEQLSNKAALRYLRQVRRLLPCSRKLKDEITSPLRESLAAFTAEKPDADGEAVLARFGAPESIAASCLENTDTGEVLRKLQVKQRIVAVVVAAVILVLASWIGFLAHADISAKAVREGYTINEIIIDSNAEASSLDTNNEN